MTVYIVVFVLIILSGFFIYNIKKPLEKKNKQFLILSSIVLTLVSGLRGHSVGADTESYAQWFTYLSNFSWNELLRNNWIDIEPGYKIFNYVLSKISDNPQIVIFTSSVVIIFSLMYFLYKYSENVFVSVLLFLGLNHYLTSLNTYRSYLALAIIVWVYDALLDKKYVRAAILIVVGYSFHRISIVFSLVLLMAYLLRKKRRYVIVAVAALIAMVPLIPLAMNLFATIYPKYMLYLRYDTLESKKGTLNIIFFIMEVVIIIYWFLQKDIETSEINMQIIMLSASAVLRIVGNIIPRGFRLVQMLNIAILLIIPYLISKSNANRRVYIPVISIASLTLYIYYLSTNVGRVVPYIFLESNGH